MVTLKAFLISLSLPVLVIFYGGLPATSISTLGTITSKNASVNKTALAMISEKNIAFNNELTEEPGGKGRFDPSGGLGRMG